MYIKVEFAALIEYEKIYKNFFTIFSAHLSIIFFSKSSENKQKNECANVSGNFFEIKKIIDHKVNAYIKSNKSRTQTLMKYKKTC